MPVCVCPCWDKAYFPEFLVPSSLYARWTCVACGCVFWLNWVLFDPSIVCSEESAPTENFPYGAPIVVPSGKWDWLETSTCSLMAPDLPRIWFQKSPHLLRNFCKEQSPSGLVSKGGWFHSRVIIMRLQVKTIQVLFSSSLDLPLFLCS